VVYKQLPPERFQFYPGWFKDTLPLIDPGTRFCLVNVDCDLYESTRDVLDELFRNKRLSDGCILLFDDYLENRASKKFGQRKAWEECKAKFAPDLTDRGPYGIGGWRFIVHT
jgi:hypothetical protein